MVVYMVTLSLRVSMRRSTRFSALLSTLRSVSAGALVLASIVSCSDSMSPNKGLDGVVRVRVNSLGVDVPDSLKQALSAQSAANLLSAPLGFSATVLAPTSGSSTVVSGPSCGSGNAFAGYTEQRVAFSPEAIPMYAPYPIYDDKYIPDMPLGFSFSFQGNTYDKVNVFSNGFLQFGQASSSADGFYRGGIIPSATNPNNIIAFAWTDWSPQLVPNGIRYETRGDAPNRKFILQYTDVPEYNSGSRVGAIKLGVGRLTAQVVLSEGSNDITIYTNTFNLNNSNNRYTQGIENAAGMVAQFDTIINPNTGVWTTRVAKFFTNIRLTNDAVRFSLISTKDEVAPSITAPDNISQGNDLHLASAVVAVGTPIASDNCGDVALSSARSDGAAINAPYPVGVTTITWTATDAAGNKASATQTVTVIDIEPPEFPSSTARLMAQSQSSLTFNATSPSGAVVTYQVNATDNVGVTSLVCEPASGSQFPIGNTTVTCTASDAARNTASESFDVHVASAQEQLATLMSVLRGLNLPNGTAQPLINQLKAANGNELACKKLSDFMDMLVKKQSNIDPTDFATLAEMANTLGGAMGCTELGSPAPARSPSLKQSPNRVL